MHRYPAEVWISIALAGVTLIIFAGTLGNDFVDYDDNFYVTSNPQVKAGLTPDSVAWAFTTLHAGNWHPLTWLSLQLDAQIFGIQPWGFHLTNTLLHAANTLLLFWALLKLTGAIWESALVSALFAVHPLHVESVAWVAERKDVLSAFFWMLALLTYAEYSIGGGRRYYLFTVIAFAIGLLAKPMLVTLPFVLLLLDYWPLMRAEVGNGPGRRRAGSANVLKPTTIIRTTSPPYRFRRAVALVVEKLPLLLLAGASCFITWYAQQQGRAIRSLGDFPLATRVANAAVSYVVYLGQTVWPADLGVFYPHPAGVFTTASGTGFPVWRTVLAGALLVAVSLVAIGKRKEFPEVFVGWFWYLGTLLPVIGLVQLGGQARADRYTYIPLIGIFVAVVWSGARLVRRGHWERAANYVSAGVVALLALASWFQIGHWRDSRTLWKHTIEACGESTLAESNLAVTYLNEFDQQGGSQNLEQSAYHYAEAIRLDPDNVHAITQLAAVRSKQGQTEAAVELLNRATRLRPNWELPYYNLGVAYTQLKRPKEAIDAYSEALRINPQMDMARHNLQLLLDARPK
jgi:tetratricopeptide (TPR) repeat protein